MPGAHVLALLLLQRRQLGAQRAHGPAVLRRGRLRRLCGRRRRAPCPVLIILLRRRGRACGAARLADRVACSARTGSVRIRRALNGSIPARSITCVSMPAIGPAVRSGPAACLSICHRMRRCSRMRLRRRRLPGIAVWQRCAAAARAAAAAASLDGPTGLALRALCSARLCGVCSLVGPDAAASAPRLPGVVGRRVRALARPLRRCGRVGARGAGLGALGPAGRFGRRSTPASGARCRMRSACHCAIAWWLARMAKMTISTWRARGRAFHFLGSSTRRTTCHRLMRSAACARPAGTNGCGTQAEVGAGGTRATESTLRT